ncbi:hypothetical protein DMENIID0001_147180 [Sergentomyia squamirostris]
MNSKDALFVWLDRPELGPLRALRLATTIWNSIDYANLSKYETLVGYFCHKLPEYCELADQHPDMWPAVQEFVELKYPIGMVTSESKTVLVNTLLDNLDDISLRNFMILKAAAQNPSLGSFYGSNISTYGKLISRCFLVWRQILQQEEDKEDLDVSEKQITESLLGNFKEFAQYHSNNPPFRKIYLQDIQKNLTELIISLTRRKFFWKKNLFIILRGLFFTDDSVNFYKSYFDASGKVDSSPEDHLVFTREDLHLTLFNIEAFMNAYSSRKDFCGSFIKFLMETVFHPDHVTLDHTILAINHVMTLMKSYNIKFSPKEDEISALLRRQILDIVAKFAESHTKDCLSLLLRVSELNPLILEEDLLSLIIKFTFLPKNDEIMTIYSQFFILCLQTFYKLSRFEKMLHKLLDSITRHPVPLDLCKKLKRKSSSSETPKKKRKTASGEASEVDPDATPSFLSILTENFAEKQDFLFRKSSGKWSEISFAWSEEISERFSQIILTLVPNASFVVWKTLLFSLQEALDSESSNNGFFALEYVTNMMIAFLKGCRLLEKPDNVVEKIDERRAMMADVFRKFEKYFPEGSDTNSRPLRIFMELLCVVLDFDTALGVYRPDFMDKDSSGKFRKLSYIDEFTWKGVRDQIQDEDLQQLKSSIDLRLLKVKVMENNFPEISENVDGALNIIQSEALVQKEVEWMMKTLKRNEKISLAKEISGNMENPRIEEMFEDADFLWILFLTLLDEISQEINSKKAPFCKIDFNPLMNAESSFQDLFEGVISQLKTVNLRGKIAENNLLGLLRKILSLPLGFLAKAEKNKALFLILILLHSLMDFEDLKSVILDILTMLTELGNDIDAFTYISVVKITDIFPDVSRNIKLYDILFAAATKYQTEANIGSFTELTAFLERKDNPLAKDLCMIAVVNFVKSRNFKQFEKQLKKISKKLSLIALKFLDDDQDLQCQLPAITATLSAFLNSKPDSYDLAKNIARRSLKLCGDFNNFHCIELLKIILDHKKVLDISQDDITPLLQDLFDQMKRGLGSNHTIEDPKIPVFINVLLTNCTSDQLRSFLKAIEQEISIVDHQYICKFLGHFGKCSMNEEHGEIFSQAYDEIMQKIVQKIVQQDHQDFVEIILKTHTIIMKNTKILMSNTLFQNILTFLIEINLKRLKINIKDFSGLCFQMIELCNAMNQHRSSCLRFTMPQFVTIFKNLIYAICGYRNDRNKDEKLDQNELTTLTDLAHKLEQMVALIASKTKKSNRVAPFMLVSVINEMIYNQNSTTLNLSIKSHFNNICYSLISMCDPNYSQFILRSCSEASRNVYKTLVKEYGKYYKFHGKV